MYLQKKLSYIFISLFALNALGQHKPNKTIDAIEANYQYIGKCFDNHYTHQQLLAVGDSMAKKYAKNLAIAEFAIYHANHMACFLHPQDLIQQYRGMRELVSASKTPSIKPVYKFNLGDMLFNHKEYNTGINLMLEAVQEFKNKGYENVPVIGEMLYALSNHYYNFGNYRISMYYSQLAVQYSPIEKQPGQFNTIGMCYQKLGQYDSAILYFNKVLETGKNFRGNVWLAIAEGNIGRTFCLQKKYAAGIPLLWRDVQNNRDYEPENSALSALYIAEAFTEMRNPDSAWYYIRMSKDIFTAHNVWTAEELGKYYYAQFYFLQLSKYYMVKGDYRQALFYADSTSFFKEKYRSQFDWRLLNSAEKRIEGLEYEKNLKVLAAEKKNEQLQKLILIIVLAGLVFITILLVNRQRLKLKKERQIATQKEENLLLRQQQAQQELDNAHQQLTEFVKNIQDKNALIDKITNELTNISQNKIMKEQQEVLTDALHELKHSTLLTNEDWLRFQERFEKVYKGFFTRLSLDIPTITPAEERLLALAKLHISSRQMGLMLGISPASVRTAKYRLRKKLVMSQDASMLALLDNEPDIETE